MSTEKYSKETRCQDDYLIPYSKTRRITEGNLTYYEIPNTVIGPQYVVTPQNEVLSTLAITYSDDNARAMAAVPEMIDLLKYITKWPSLLAPLLPYDKSLASEKVRLEGCNRVLEDFAFKATAILKRIEGDE